VRDADIFLFEDDPNEKANSGVLTQWTWGVATILIIAAVLVYLALN
jgi:hypothetical protein